MIKLILHFASDTKVQLDFDDLTAYTNYVLFHQGQFTRPDFLHFEVKACVRHHWRYIPPAEREGDSNFECPDCGGKVMVCYSMLDDLFRESVKS